MKILAIGDAHGNLEKIKKIPIIGIDSIFLTGDLGSVEIARKKHWENIRRKRQGLPELKYLPKDAKENYMEIYNSTLDILKYLSNFAPTYSILGGTSVNMIHDYIVKKEEKKYKIKLPSLRQGMDKLKNFDLVRNNLRRINGTRVGFLEYFADRLWVKEFNPKDYNKSMNKAKKETEKAKKILERFGYVDILLCHQPPYRVLDKIDNPSSPNNGLHIGSKVILNYIKKYQPKYVFCGHIHEAKGKKKIGKTEVYNLGLAGHKTINI